MGSHAGGVEPGQLTYGAFGVVLPAVAVRRRFRYAAAIVTVAECSAGNVVPSSITLAFTPGVAYTLDPPGPYDPLVETTVIVTATLADGFARGQPAALPASSRADGQLRSLRQRR